MQLQVSFCQLQDDIPASAPICSLHSFTDFCQAARQELGNACIHRSSLTVVFGIGKAVLSHTCSCQQNYIGQQIPVPSWSSVCWQQLVHLADNETAIRAPKLKRWIHADIMFGCLGGISYMSAMHQAVPSLHTYPLTRCIAAVLPVLTERVLGL